MNENLSHETYSIYLNVQFPPPPPSQALSCVADIYGNLRSKNFQRQSLCEKTLKEKLTDAAYETFRKCSANLIKIIQDHDLPRLKWELHSAGVVSISVAEKVSMDWFILERRKAKPLSVFGNQISVNPVSKMPILSGEICK